MGQQQPQTQLFQQAGNENDDDDVRSIVITYFISFIVLRSGGELALQDYNGQGIKSNLRQSSRNQDMRIGLPAIPGERWRNRLYTAL
jgi:hypothetical protein